MYLLAGEDALKTQAAWRRGALELPPGNPRTTQAPGPPQLRCLDSYHLDDEQSCCSPNVNVPRFGLYLLGHVPRLSQCPLILEAMMVLGCGIPPGRPFFSRLGKLETAKYMTRPLQQTSDLFRSSPRHSTFFFPRSSSSFSSSSFSSFIEPVSQTFGKMGYGEIDQKAINTIRTLAVSFFPLPLQLLCIGFYPATPAPPFIHLGFGGDAQRNVVRETVSQPSQEGVTASSALLFRWLSYRHRVGRVPGSSVALITSRKQRTMSTDELSTG